MFEQNKMLVKGDYAIPFEFVLPDDCPASIEFSDERSNEKPKARV